MIINSLPKRASSTDMLWAAPPGRPALQAADTLPEDRVEISFFDPAESKIRPHRNSLLMALGWGLMAAGRLVNMLPGPSAPAIICATELVPNQEGSRLEQVLLCERVTSPTQLKQSIHRANYAWEGLRAHMGEGLENLHDRPGDQGHITAWPYGQVMTAALNQAKLSGDYSDFEQLVKGLEQYRHPEGGYAASKGPFGILGSRFYDDNAWLGLVFVQAAQQATQAGYLEKAEEIAAFLRASQQADGGLLWEEGNAHPSYNTCTFGPSIELSLRLYQMTGEEKHLEFAGQLTDIMESKMRRPDGLYLDNVQLETGQADHTLWSYNQGTPVGAHLLWYRITGEQAHLEKAKQTATAALQHFGEEGLWKQAPAFNAIFFRNLMKLEDPAVDKALEGYLEKVWSQALDQDSGLFHRSGHGMGSYEGHGDVSTIDQAGLVQLYALQDWSAGERHQVS